MAVRTRGGGEAQCAHEEQGGGDGHAGPGLKWSGAQVVAPAAAEEALDCAAPLEATAPLPREEGEGSLLEIEAAVIVGLLEVGGPPTTLFLAGAGVRCFDSHSFASTRSMPLPRLGSV